MLNAVIEIDSDNEGYDDAPAPAVLKLAEDVACVKPEACLSCEFAFSKTAAVGKCQLFKLAHVSISPSEEGGSTNGGGFPITIEAELQLSRNGANVPSQVARLPIVNVIRFDVRDDCEIHVVLSSPLDASRLGWPPARHAARLDEFMLVFSPTEIPMALATLRSWLPHFSQLGTSFGGSLPCAEVLPLTLHGITLTARDVQLLGEQTWLNDKCLDFFMKLALELVAPQSLRGQIWVVDSLFYQQLAGSCATSGEEGWQNVSGWRQFRGEGVLGRPYMFLPMNLENTHWWLAVVCNPNYALESTPRRRTKGEAPRIVCLDSSLEPEPKLQAANFLRGYIWREWCRQDIVNVASAAALAQRRVLNSSLKLVDADVPKQLNSHDCGIFLIEYLLHIFKSGSALLALGIAPHRHWFRQDAVSHRRRCLRLVAAGLQAEANRRGESDVGRLLEDESLRRKLALAFVEKPPGQCPQHTKRKAPG